jgi:hypothetical protein
MTYPPSAEDLERLVKVWFAEARQLSAHDQAEFDAWKKEHRKWTYFTGSGLGASYAGSDAGDCGGD